MNHETAIPVKEVVKELAPQRRFRPYPEYRDSGVEWLGELPVDWQADRLKWTVTMCRNGIWGDEPDGVNDIACVRVADFDRIRFLVHLQQPTIRAVAPSQRVGRLLSRGDLLLEKSGGGELQPVGAVMLFDHDREAVCSNFVARMPVTTGFDARFLAYFHAHLYSGRVNTRSIKQTTGIQNLDSDSYLNELVPFVPVLEQQAIVRFLDRETARIDELVAKKQRLIELLAEKRTALTSHAVTKGLNPDAPMKDSGIEWFGNIPDHWKITRLGWVSMEVSDINHEMPTSAADGVAFLSAKDLLDDGTLNFSHAIKRISEDDFERLSRKSRPRRGDIIYSRIGACLGKARLVEVDKRFLVSYSCCVVRVKPSVADRRFFRHLLDAEMVLTEAKMRTQGIGVPDLGLSEICRFPVPLPPKSEQLEIADYLDEKEATLRLLSRRINDGLEQLREYRSALISAAVTGKIDVREMSK